jgi:Flp pilus assembly protein TadD
VDKAEAARQMTFGVKMAQAGSWNEAAFRFTKAVHANPGNAFAQNDLGVALESIGQYDQALASYTKALELEPGNAKIKENKDRLQAYLATRNAPKPKEKPAPPAPGGAGG